MTARFTYFVGAFAIGVVSREQQQDRLNEFGLQGWELVNIARERVENCEYNFFYFKRPHQTPNSKGTNRRLKPAGKTKK